LRSQKGREIFPAFFCSVRRDIFSPAISSRHNFSLDLPRAEKCQINFAARTKIFADFLLIYVDINAAV
jgi:hypothetical protein